MTIKIDKSFKAQWVHNVTNQDYHADKSAISSTALRRLLVSQRAYQFEFLEGNRREETKALIFGNRLHEAVIDPDDFNARYVKQPDFGNCTFKDNKARRDAWRASLNPGIEIIDAEDFDAIVNMRKSVEHHKDAITLLERAVTEHTGYYADPETGILCRFRPDILTKDGLTLADIKTTTDISKHAFASSVAKYGYHIQLAMYAEGVKQITGVEVQNFRFIAVDKSAPWECAVYHADEEMMRRGREEYRKALNILKSCLETKTYAPFQTDAEIISLPGWAV